MKQFFTRFSLLCLLVAGYFSANAQRIWSDVLESSISANNDMRKIIPNKFRTMSLDIAAVQIVLQSAPMENTAAAKNHPVILSIPMPDGSLAAFSIVKTKMMEDGLAAQFPNIKTYGGQGIDDPFATIKIDWTEYGFRAQILSAVKGATYIDPYAFGDLSHYISYNKADLSPRYRLIEDGIIAPAGKVKDSYLQRTQTVRCVGGSVRAYRLAVACTGEYAKAATGQTNPTVAQVLSTITTTVNRVDGVYETDLDLRLVLIANETAIIYTTPGVGFTTAANNNANTLINASQTVITNVIGSANYDMGHTFSTGGGGLSGLGIICKSAQKASSITGSPQPTGDAYDIDFVAHEMGHAVGCEHTFNSDNSGNCTGNASPNANAEPGSGISIMAYAGICDLQDLAAHSIPYFHPVSFEQATAYTIAGTGSTCGTIISITNNPPVVNAGSDYIIPKSTPFMLTGTASDPDGDAITYDWEQVDVGGPFGNWNAPVGDAPIFRPFSPVAVPYRYFPKLSNVINNTVTIGEILPTYARSMHFRLTARDNKMGGGGVCGDEDAITVNEASGPFVVTSPNTAGTWVAGHCQTITWDVANTNAAPVSCANVSIELSTDGGFTFPTVLLASTPNDGKAQAFIPDNISTTAARIRVKAVDNVFYDMSNANFTIVLSTHPEYDMCTPEPVTACPNASVSFLVSTSSINGFTTPITFSATGNPPGSTVLFAPNPVNPGSDVTVTVQGNFPSGVYPMNITGVADTVSRTVIANFEVGTLAPVQVSPADNALGVAQKPTFTWQPSSNTTSYTLEIADNAAFSGGTVTYTTSNTSFTLPDTLLLDTEYWWRVTPTSSCGTGPASAIFHFKTGAQVCDASATPSTNVPLPILTTAPNIVTSNLNIITGGIIKDVDVVGLQGTHTYISDLTVSLTSPSNTTITLFDQVCTNKQNFNINFDDEASTVTLPCPPIGGITRQPAQALSNFDGENSTGMWTLTVTDNYTDDGGSLDGWGLRFCTLQSTPFPVNWLTFTGHKNENKTVSLTWATANEMNNDHYEIERSNDGMHFSSFGRITAGNNPSAVQNYYYTDMKPYKGANYYRLKQVDKDGRFDYSKVVRVLIDNTVAEYTVYPNPATDKSTVRILSDLKQLSLRITDALGKVVYQKNAGAVKAGQEIVIPVKAFGDGMYVLTAITENGTSTQKIVVE